MGRKIRNDPLMCEAILVPKYDISSHLTKQTEHQAKQKDYHDRSTQKLCELQPNEPILIQQGVRNWTKGRVINKDSSPESYTVTTNEGRVYRRNRIHLRPFRTMDQQTTVETTTPSSTYTSNSESEPEVEKENVTNLCNSDTDRDNNELKQTITRPQRFTRKPKYLSDYITH